MNMTTMMWRAIATGVLLSCTTATLLSSPGQARESSGNGQYMAVYFAQNSPERMLDILRGDRPELQSSYLAALTRSVVLGHSGWLRWEAEAQLVYHTGMQNHWESNAVLVARQMKFPWDDVLDTRVAVGNGLSWAFEEPPLEPRGDPEDGESARLLNYTLVELEFSPPGDSDWSLFSRLHHRSGVMRTFSDIKGGSNFLGLGLRFRID